jgi:hypothetical protein
LDNFPSDEELERLKRSNVPEAVIKQETDAIEYFEENNEANHFKVVEYVKKLRAEGKITYKDL